MSIGQARSIATPRFSSEGAGQNGVRSLNTV
jgi:hypothetical protein